MKKKSILTYLLLLVVCFLAGCGLALLLRYIDAQQIEPISGGQTLDFSAYGFTLRVPEDYTLSDYTQENAEAGGNALFAGSAASGERELNIFCYTNDVGDSLGDYEEQELVTYYTSMGAQNVRTYTLGNRRFIYYRVSVSTDDGDELWDTYETWDASYQLTVETQMAQRLALSILATIQFDE